LQLVLPAVCSCCPNPWRAALDPRSRLPAKMILDGSYQIESVIGAGGFGITYRAEDLNLKTSVALKEYYPESYGDRDHSMSVRPKSERHQQTFEWGLASFLREAQMLARFRHPSVVRVARVFEANATAYMVMDFEKGKSFADWLVGLGRRPTQAELDRIVAPLLEALALMHRQNFLHRDIAPDNIIIRDDGSPVLLDFGAARRAVAEISRSITSIVKGGYSPPEQYASDSRAQGPWTDLYALGATLYLAVAGRPPDDSPSRADTDVMPSAARAAIGTYRPGFLAAIDRCLAVKASARPQSVEQLRPLLLGQEGPRTSGRPSKAGLATSASPRRPLRWLAAVAAAVVLLAGGYAGVELLGKRLQVAAPDPKAQVPRADPTTAADAGNSQTMREAQELRAREDARLKAEAQREAEARQREEQRLAAERAARELSQQEDAAQAEARAEGGTPETAAKVAREAPASEAKVALAPSPPVPVSKQPFDGVWRATITAANDFCVYKSGDFLLSITNGAIVGGKGYHTGSVSSAGDLVMTGPARANPAFKVRFTAKLSEGRGQGQYRVLQGKCIGSFAVKKLS